MPDLNIENFVYSPFYERNPQQAKICSNADMLSMSLHTKTSSTKKLNITVASNLAAQVLNMWLAIPTKSEYPFAMSANDAAMEELRVLLQHVLFVLSFKCFPAIQTLVVNALNEKYARIASYNYSFLGVTLLICECWNASRCLPNN